MKRLLLGGLLSCFLVCQTSYSLPNKTGVVAGALSVVGVGTAMYCGDVSPDIVCGTMAAVGYFAFFGLGALQVYVARGFKSGVRRYTNKIKFFEGFTLGSLAAACGMTLFFYNVCKEEYS
ncbi:MAG: hypothetical protein WD055_06040 [Candidatus Dependentiae bacterium]